MGWLGGKTERQAVEEVAGPRPTGVQRAIAQMDADDARQAARKKAEDDRRAVADEELASAWNQACADEGLDADALAEMVRQLQETTAKRQEAEAEVKKQSGLESVLRGRLDGLSARVRETVSRSAAFRPGEYDAGFTNPLIGQLNRAAVESHSALARRVRGARTATARPVRVPTSTTAPQRNVTRAGQQPVVTRMGGEIVGWWG